MAKMMLNVLFLVISLCTLLVRSQDMEIYGCSGKGFTGQCQSFSCGYQDCCTLPSFFQTRLVSVRSTGPYDVRLFTAEGCKLHCNDNDNQGRLVDRSGWSNIGTDAYSCVDGPF